MDRHFRMPVFVYIMQYTTCANRDQSSRSTDAVMASYSTLLCIMLHMESYSCDVQIGSIECVHFSSRYGINLQVIGSIFQWSHIFCPSSISQSSGMRLIGSLLPSLLPSQLQHFPAPTIPDGDLAALRQVCWDDCDTVSMPPPLLHHVHMLVPTAITPPSPFPNPSTGRSVLGQTYLHLPNSSIGGVRPERGSKSPRCSPHHLSAVHAQVVMRLVLLPLLVEEPAVLLWGLGVGGSSLGKGFCRHCLYSR
ncbi:hypothetical protein K431DRAFT_41340 [Polychaeton citri CBS 116435]|uniref:Uncharacterized protein n=1 Tax=Polychaeton citri CBS 116435 TaxID=1314669 RepID=A0A9P4UNP0_9PEZI|nr:hypothetical protein K431DRAFT_41340 [Polychaeton citri CBS 116435]